MIDIYFLHPRPLAILFNYTYWLNVKGTIGHGRIYIWASYRLCKPCRAHRRHHEVLRFERLKAYRKPQDKTVTPTLIG